MGLRAAFCIGLLPPGPFAVVQQEFEELWEVVAVGQLSRVGQQEQAPPIQHVCQYGLSESTLEIARFLLGRARPAIEKLEFYDVVSEPEDPHRKMQMLAELEVEFGERVRHGAAQWQGREAVSPCDLVLFSEAAPRFSIDRVLPQLGDYAVFAWVSEACVAEQSSLASPSCNFLNTMWERSSLMKRGYCTQGVCMARVPSGSLQDPNVIPLDCTNFLSENGSNASMAEFGQDWFIFWNFLRAHRGAEDRESGIYVDVGASLPFDYSNTVMFDRCLGWRGVCVEPNPHLISFLEAYRSCEVYHACVEENVIEGKTFSDNLGNVQFTADCLPLGEILKRAGLTGHRIDVLSVDVEYGELGVLSGLNFEEFDIRFIVMEVSTGARWLEVDTVILPLGYAKVAVLGRDVVYAKLSELLPGTSGVWPLLAGGDGAAADPVATLPWGWADFHRRVVDEELKEEMRRERQAFYEGKRRR